MLRIGKRLDLEFQIVIALASLCLLLGAVAIYLYDTHKRPWQSEAEGVVEFHLPVGTPRARVAAWLASSDCYTRDSTRQTIHIYAWSGKMRHRPSPFYDSVVVDVHFDASQKVAGYCTLTL